MPATIELPIEAIERVCRAHGISRLALFGSILGDDFGPDSDVDLLVESPPGRTPGLRFFAIQEELSEILGRSVDLNTPASLSEHFRDDVPANAETIYVAA